MRSCLKVKSTVVSFDQNSRVCCFKSWQRWVWGRAGTQVNLPSQTHGCQQQSRWGEGRRRKGYHRAWVENSVIPTGKKNKLRVYYLSWLRNRILHNDPEVEKKQGWITVGDLEGCIHYKVGKSQSGRVRVPGGCLVLSICCGRCVCHQFKM